MQRPRHFRHGLLTVIVAVLLSVGALAAPAYASGLAMPPAPAQEAAGEHQQPVATPGHEGAEGTEGTTEGTAQEAVGSEPAVQEHEQEEHGPTWTEYAFKWANFILLVALLYWLLVVPPPFVIENFDFPGLKVVLAARSQDIVAARAFAQQQQRDAAEGLASSEERLKKVGDEIDALLADARAAAETERQRVEAVAVEEAELIREGAASDLDAQIIRARRDLRQHVAELAVSIARDLLKGSFSEQDQQRLVRQYLDRLGTAVG